MMDVRSFYWGVRGQHQKQIFRLLITTCLWTSILFAGFHFYNKWTFPDSLFTPKCVEKHDIVYLKIHKTGSSTIANILQRFGYFSDLNFALPNKKPGEVRYNYFGTVGEPLKPQHIIPTKSRSDRYNILYNHVIFDRKSFLKIFPKNRSVFVTMLRDPVHQFFSAVLFFRHDNILEAARKNVTSYLEHPEVYEPKDGPYHSFTNNRQALDLGLPPSKLRNKAYIERYIKMLDKIFDPVLITEYFDESLIILKRRMCWSYKDILYMKINTAYQSFDFKLTLNDQLLLRNWSLADHLIYEHFYHKFHIILKNDPDIMAETYHFKTILERTRMFCNGSTSDSRLEIQRSEWHQQFRVTALDCAYMQLGELKFLNKLLHDKMN